MQRNYIVLMVIMVTCQMALGSQDSRQLCCVEREALKVAKSAQKRDKVRQKLADLGQRVASMAVFLDAVEEPHSPTRKHDFDCVYQDVERFGQRYHKTLRQMGDTVGPVTIASLQAQLQDLAVRYHYFPTFAQATNNLGVVVGVTTSVANQTQPMGYVVPVALLVPVALQTQREPLDDDLYYISDATDEM